MVPLMMLLASCDTDGSANGIKLPKPKSHVASHIDFLNLINAVVSFTMPLASCDANTG